MNEKSVRPRSLSAPDRIDTTPANPAISRGPSESRVSQTQRDYKIASDGPVRNLANSDSRFSGSDAQQPRSSEAAPSGSADNPDAPVGLPVALPTTAAGVHHPGASEVLQPTARTAPRNSMDLMGATDLVVESLLAFASGTKPQSLVQTAIRATTKALQSQMEAGVPAEVVMRTLADEMHRAIGVRQAREIAILADVIRSLPQYPNKGERDLLFRRVVESMKAVEGLHQGSLRLSSANRSNFGGVWSTVKTLGRSAVSAVGAPAGETARAANRAGVRASMAGLLAALRPGRSYSDHQVVSGLCSFAESSELGISASALSGEEVDEWLTHAEDFLVEQPKDLLISLAQRLIETAPTRAPGAGQHQLLLLSRALATALAARPSTRELAFNLKTIPVQGVAAESDRKVYWRSRIKLMLQALPSANTPERASIVKDLNVVLSQFATPNLRAQLFRECLGGVASELSVEHLEAISTKFGGTQYPALRELVESVRERCASLNGVGISPDGSSR